MSQTDYKQILNDVVSDLELVFSNYHPNSYSAFVFGSYVTKETSKGSDLDIVCLFEDHNLKQEITKLQEKYSNTPVKFWVGSLEDCLKEEAVFSPIKPIDEDVWLHLGNYYLQFIMGHQGQHLLGKDVVKLFKERARMYEIPKEEAYEMYLISTRHLALGYLRDDKNLLAKAVARATLSWALLEGDRIPKNYKEIFDEGRKLLGYVGLKEKEKFLTLLKKMESIKTGHATGIQTEDLNLIFDYFDLVNDFVFDYVFEEGLVVNPVIQSNIEEFLNKTSEIILRELEGRKDYDVRFLLFFIEELVDFIYKENPQLEKGKDLISEYIRITSDVKELKSRHLLSRAKARYIGGDLNGSLRDIDKFIDILDKEPNAKNVYLLSKNSLKSEAYTLRAKLVDSNDEKRMELLKAIRLNPLNNYALDDIEANSNNETKEVAKVIRNILKHPLYLVEVYSSRDFEGDKELFESFVEGLKQDSRTRIDVEMEMTISRISDLRRRFNSEYELLNNVLEGKMNPIRPNIYHRITMLKITREELEMYVGLHETLKGVKSFLDNEDLVPFYRTLVEEYFKAKKKFIRMIKLLEQIYSEIVTDEIATRDNLTELEDRLGCGYIADWQMLTGQSFKENYPEDYSKIKSLLEELRRSLPNIEGLG